MPLDVPVESILASFIRYGEIVELSEEKGVDRKGGDSLSFLGFEDENDLIIRCFV